MTKSWRVHNALFLRLFVILLTTGLGLFLFQKGLTYSLFCCICLLTLLLLELYFFFKNVFSFYDKTISAILQNDFSSSYSKEYQFGNYKKLYELYDVLKTRAQEQTSREIIYQSILNNIDSGVLILEKESDEWTIFLMNDYFSDYFTVPKVSKWLYLKNQLPAFCKVIEDNNFEELKAPVQIRVNENSDPQTFILQSSLSKANNKEYYIILLDSIQRVIEKKEKEAWINLMKVISHELMNSLTPIRSLSQNLQDIVNQDTLSNEDFEDIRLSLSTIVNRSDQLQFFVDNYRKLAMLPSPQKTKTELKILLDECIAVMSPLFKKNGITLRNTVDFNRQLHLDKQQMEQVIINLFTNSIFSLENSDAEDRFIEVAASFSNNRFYLTISDNGFGIDAAIKDKIFLPFFTTRKDGAGIGLTLSKNIIEAHGGYLSYQSDEQKTTFIICLIENSPKEPS